MADTNSSTSPKRRTKGRLYIAFVAIALLGGSLPILLSSDFTHEFSIIGSDKNIRFLHESNSNSNGNSETTEVPQKKRKNQDGPSRVAGLDCTPWGGPKNEAAAEMVYWEDIPQDNKHVSPFYDPDGPTQYLSFEMDFAGWNNVRMSMESLLGVALAMGRTLVLPPAQEVHLLDSSDETQKNEFAFNHFYPMDHVNEEQEGFNIISMDDYLKLFVQGKFTNKHGTPVYPPGNRTNWDGAGEEDLAVLNGFLRDASMWLRWKPNRCLGAFPKSRDLEDLQQLADELENITKTGFPEEKDLIRKPPAVDASSLERMRHTIAKRERLCLYSSKLQKAERLHFPMLWDETYGKSRMLTHFYGFLHFQDWRQDLWIKRFMRDHIRYVDEIQCAAARVVNRIRAHVHQRTEGKSTDFYTLHIRRNDFQDQYSATDVNGEDILSVAKRKIPKNATVYIATDDDSDDFFKPLEKYYNVLFMEDFKKQLHGVNSNYMGMIDQLISSRGKVFMGCFYSTFTGYINRLRGYHADNAKLPGYEQGIVESYYYAPEFLFLRMQAYFPVWEPIWAREFPTAWRLIDKDIDEEIVATK